MKTQYYTAASLDGFIEQKTTSGVAVRAWLRQRDQLSDLHRRGRARHGLGHV